MSEGIVKYQKTLEVIGSEDDKRVFHNPKVDGSIPPVATNSPTAYPST